MHKELLGLSREFSFFIINKIVLSYKVSLKFDSFKKLASHYVLAYLEHLIDILRHPSHFLFCFI